MLKTIALRSEHRYTTIYRECPPGQIYRNIWPHSTEGGSCCSNNLAILSPARYTTNNMWEKVLKDYMKGSMKISMTGEILNIEQNPPYPPNVLG